MEVCKKTHIVSATGAGSFDNLSSMFAKVYQAKYLAGMTAGYLLGSTKRKKNCVGYIGGEIIPEVYRGFNAFYLGCFRANPKCTVRAVFLKTFHNAPLERSAANYMWHEEECDIIAQETDSAEPSIVFSKEGGYSIGYNSDMSSVVGNRVLTSPYVAWGILYAHFLNRLMNEGFLTGEFYWPGMEVIKGAVNLWPFSNQVDMLTRSRVTHVWQKIQDGKEEVFCKEKYGLNKDVRGEIEPIPESDFKENGCLKTESLLRIGLIH
eukprot:TRINITY_DN7646_c0_g2_i1.p1 TRINITY_DN7646_c0_g2~~TRINITY_DN7646_c0_g2_i1.p1  ORF type:complete len:293 (+),score=54.65 TRINITY_DN7646_c0_g2_i1:90-881(+)